MARDAGQKPGANQHAEHAGASVAEKWQCDSFVWQAGPMAHLTRKEAEIPIGGCRA